jgi:hypothetical protein
MKPDTRKGVSRGSRFAAGLPATVAVGDREIRCTAHNLSRSGVLLVGPLPIRPGGALEVRLRSPLGDKEVLVRGRVARAEKVEDGDENRIALSFIELTKEQHDAIEVLVARVVEGQAPAPIRNLKPGAPVEEVLRALDQIPLPHRIALATRAGPKERDFLRQDRHPQVLEALARNPGLLPAEARVLAANREILPTTLELLAADPRWRRDVELKILLASHPRVSLPLAEKIIGKLGTPELRKLIQKPGIHPGLRVILLRRLKK